MTSMLGWAGVFGALGVVVGAFGAHWMPSHLEAMGLPGDLIEKRLSQFDVGVHYHLLHAVSMLVLAVTTRLGQRARQRAFALMVLGVVLFSGSLYVLVLTDTPRWGAVTPLGGLSWIAAWIILAADGFLSSRESSSHDLT